MRPSGVLAQPLQTGRVAVLVALLVLPACAAVGLAPSRDGGAPPALPTPAPGPEVRWVAPTHTYGVSGSASLRDVEVVREPERPVVGRAAAGPAGSRGRGVVAVFPLPDRGSACLLRAGLVLDADAVTGEAPVAAYPGAATSLADGVLPPRGQADAALVLSHRPRGLGVVAAPGTVEVDVTDVYRRWERGGPFPSTGRTVRDGTPLVLVIRTPSADQGGQLTLGEVPVLRVQLGPTCATEPLPPVDAPRPAAPEPAPEPAPAEPAPVEPAPADPAPVPVGPAPEAPPG